MAPPRTTPLGEYLRRLKQTPLHLVSAFAAGAGLVLGQQATAVKSNEKTAIPELLATLALEGCIVTIDAMGTQPDIAQAIRDRGADHILSVKSNQPTLAESMADFFATFQATPDKTTHSFDEVVEKSHGRVEVRRCYAFNQIDYLASPERWPDLISFAVIASERTIKDKTTLEFRFYTSSLPADATHLNRSIASTGASRTAFIGAWTSSLATTVCACGPITPLTTSPSCAISPSICSTSLLQSARAASRCNV